MITKRQLGIFFILLGTAAILAVVGVNLLGVGRYAGIGPSQQIALTTGGLFILVGITLLPLGNKPA